MVDAADRPIGTDGRPRKESPVTPKNPAAPRAAWASLVEARAKYDATASPFYDEVLDGVTRSIRESGSIGKADIGALLFWKRLRADTPWVRDLHEMADDDVRAITAPAVAVVQDVSVGLPEAAGAGRGLLSPLPGFRVGDALASALLTAAAPDRMAVYDRRVQIGLDALQIPLSAAKGRYRAYLTLIEDLLRNVPPNVQASWRPRDVDLALYTLGGRKSG